MQSRFPLFILMHHIHSLCCALHMCVCNQHRMHNILCTLLCTGVFSTQMHTIQSEHCSIQIDMSQLLLCYMFDHWELCTVQKRMCHNSAPSQNCCKTSHLAHHHTETFSCWRNFLPSHVFHFMACQPNPTPPLLRLLAYIWAVLAGQIF